MSTCVVHSNYRSQIIKDKKLSKYSIVGEVKLEN